MGRHPCFPMFKGKTMFGIYGSSRNLSSRFFSFFSRTLGVSRRRGREAVRKSFRRRFLSCEPLEPRQLLAAEVSVFGNSVNLIDNDTTPSPTDHTDFGSVAVGATGISRTFTVTNTGDATLTLGSLFVPAGYTVIDGLVGSLAPYVSDSLVIRLDTTTTGTKSGQISFNNNDSDENPFNFSIIGVVSAAAAPEVAVTGNAINISDNDTSPSTTDHTDFGSVAVGATGISRTFSVRNDGSATLTLGTLSVPGGYTVTDGLVGSLAPGASDTFVVRLDTFTTGTKSGQISFTNNDGDENPFNFSITGIVARANMIAYRPQHGSGTYLPFLRTRVAEADEQNSQLGTGIRLNGDDDNNNGVPDRNDTSVAGEDDLIELELEAAGATYVLARSVSALRVWTSATKGTANEITFTSNQSSALTFPVSGARTVWVEWASASHSSSATLTLRPIAGSPPGPPQDVINFHTFRSIVVALGGEDQDPIANRAQGTFQMAVGLYGEGYDAYMYDEDGVNGVTDAGAGAVYNEIVRAVRNRGVGSVAIFGYSHGGGSTWVLADRLNRDRGTIGTFTIPFTAYVDAVSKNSASQELRRPPSSLYHANYYQRGTAGTDYGLDGGPVPGADFQLDVETTAWGLNATHYTIDDLAQVIAGIRGLLVPRVVR